MNKKFINILNAHEKEERALAGSDAAIVRQIEKEFANSADILRLLEFSPEPASRLMYDARLPAEWPVIPVRKSEYFDIRKHTTSMRPYFHDHAFYELIYVHRGWCVQDFKLPDEKVVLCEKQACLLRPGAVHALGRSEQRDIILKTIIPAAMFPSEVSPFEKDTKSMFFVYETVGEQVEFFVFKLLEEVLHKRENSAEAIKNYISLLLIELGRKPRRSDGELGAELNEYFESNIREATLGGFAGSAGYSEGYAGRLIKERLGESFTTLLGRNRLQRAAKLLEGTDESVDDIAVELGYANASGLYKQFCGFYGMTPGAYRKMFR